MDELATPPLFAIRLNVPSPCEVMNLSRTSEESASQRSPRLVLPSPFALFAKRPYHSRGMSPNGYIHSVHQRKEHR